MNGMVRFTRWLQGLAALLCLAVILLSCSDSEDTTLLQPPGGGNDPGEVGEAAVFGLIEFDGSLGGVPATVYAMRGYQASCRSDFTTIHITGTLTDWDTGLWTSTPGLRNLGGCIWVGAMDLAAGGIEWKFVTDKSYDNPPDYVNVSGEEGLIGTTGAVSFGSNLIATVPAAGLYSFLLYEATEPPAYAVMPQLEAPLALVSEQTGAFEIKNLPEGTYEIIIVAEGYLDQHISGVEVADAARVDLGTVEVTSALGAIRGQVAFSDAPADPPKAWIDLFEAGGTVALMTDSTDAQGAFEITGLPTGSYDLEAGAAGYLSERVEGLEFVNGQDTDAGTITLNPGCESQFEYLEVLGEFNGWNSQGRMTQIDACTWVDTLTVALDADSVYNMKFRSDGNWDNPQDLGTCTDESDIHGLTGDLCLVSGQGTALAVKFTSTGEYEFRVDESTLTYAITPLSEIQTGTITGSVSWSDSPGEPPRTTVEVMRDGETEPVTSVRVGGDGSYTVQGILPGTYDLYFSAPGYQDADVQDVVVTGGQIAQVDPVEMQVQTTCEPSDAIEIVGDFNSWPNPGLGPHATLIGDCIWADTIRVSVTDAQGTAFNMKFRTDLAWDNDYGGCDTDTLGLQGDVCVVSGGEGALKILFPSTGDYEFRLNEMDQTYRITLLTQIDPGTIRGQIDYEDDPADPPTTTIQVRRDGTGALVATVTAEEDGSFLVDDPDLTTGLYDLRVTAPGYYEAQVQDVSVTEGQETDVGTIQLLRIVECTPSSAIEIVGDINDWPAEGEGPHATYMGNCIWADTLAITVADDPDSVLALKFRTNDLDGNDWKSCVAFNYKYIFVGQEVSGEVCGTGFYNINVKFPADGDYRFELDEARETFKIERLD